VFLKTSFLLGKKGLGRSIFKNKFFILYFFLKTKKMRKKPVNFLNDLKETSFVSTGIENFLWRWFFIVLLCLYACFSYVGEYNRCQFFLYTFLPNLKLFLIWCDSFRFFVFLIILFIIMLVLLVKFLHYWLQYSNDFDEDDDLLADLASYGFIEMDYLSENWTF
jgi:uncharacterized membrane protein